MMRRILPYLPPCFLRPRSLQGFCYLWMSVVGGRFLAPFLEDRGLSDSEIGLALAVEQLLITLCSASGGAWADKRERVHPGKGRAQVLAFGIACATLAYLLHGLSTVFESSAVVGSPASSRQAPSSFGTDAILFLHSSTYHIILRACFAMSIALVFPVLDGITIAFLHHEQAHDGTGGGSDDYGKERVYGAILWAVGNVCLAPLLDEYGFLISYPVAVLLLVASLFTIAAYVSAQVQQIESEADSASARIEITIDHDKLDAASETEDKDDQSVFSRSLQSHLERYTTIGHVEEAWVILPNCELVGMLLSSSFKVAFLVAFLCLASGQAIVDGLVFLFYEYLGGSFTQMGWTVALQVAFEVPIFNHARELLDCLGTGYILLLAGFCYVTRVGAYTIIPEGRMIYVFLLEPLHGLTFASSQTAVVDFVAKSLPEGYEASGQGFVHLIRGVGSMTALVAGGWVQEQFGPQVMYGSAALVVSFGMSILLLTLLVDISAGAIGGGGRMATKDKPKCQKSGGGEVMGDIVTDGPGVIGGLVTGAAGTGGTVTGCADTGAGVTGESVANGAGETGGAVIGAVGTTGGALTGGAVKLTIDDALARLEYGQFHTRLLLIAGLAQFANCLQIMVGFFFPQAVQPEMNLSDFQTASTTAILFVGMAFGILLVNFVKDSCGDRRTYLMATFVTPLFGCLGGIAPNWAVLMLMRFLVGMGLGGADIPWYIVMEFVPHQMRGQALLKLGFAWSLGSFVAPLLGYFLMEKDGSWPLMLCVCSAPRVLAFVVGLVYLPESPRWLMSKGQNDEAVQILRRAAMVNNQDPWSICPQTAHLMRGGKTKSGWKAIGRLFRKEWRRMLLCLLPTFFVVDFLYYSYVQLIHMAISDTDGDEDEFAFIPIAMTALAEFLGITAAILSIDGMGRVPTQALGYLIAAIFIMAVCIGRHFEESKDENTENNYIFFLSFLARLFIMAATSITRVHTAEILPNEIRPTFHLTAHALASLGAAASAFHMVSPYLDFMLVGIIVGVITVFTSVLCLTFPETKALAAGSPVVSTTLSRCGGLFADESGHDRQ